VREIIERVREDVISKFKVVNVKNEERERVIVI
jgi:hypothetical protein